MRFLVAEKLGPHKFKTPEGYLICTDAILSRTGKQEYKRSEIFGDTCDEPDKIVNIDRTDDEVFSDKAMASFENKPICIEHPDEDVNVENHNELAVGFVRDIHKGEDEGKPVMMGTLVITDKDAVEAVESGEYKELSCGYDCDIDDDDNPQQRNIRGNHVALCKHGRAGIARIVDSVDDMAKLSAEESATLKAMIEGGAGKSLYNRLSFDKPVNIHLSQEEKELLRWHRDENQYLTNEEKILLKKLVGDNIEDTVTDEVQPYTVVAYVAGVTGQRIYIVYATSRYEAFTKFKRRYPASTAISWELATEREIKIAKSKGEERFIDSKLNDVTTVEASALSAGNKVNFRGRKYTVVSVKKNAMYNGEVDITLKEDNGSKRVIEAGERDKFVLIDCNDRKNKLEDETMKDIQATKTPGTDKIIYVMQSDVDKNLYFYIGKTFSMKEGEWGYTKFEMGDDTPEKIKAELLKNGWHQVANGPARVIDAKDVWSIKNTGFAYVLYHNKNEIRRFPTRKLAVEWVTSRFPNDKIVEDDWTEVEEENYNKANKPVGAKDCVKDAEIDRLIEKYTDDPETVASLISKRLIVELSEHDEHNTALINALKKAGFKQQSSFRFVKDSIKDSKEQLFTVEYEQDGVMYVRKVRASSIEDAISRVKDVNENEIRNLLNKAGYTPLKWYRGGAGVEFEIHKGAFGNNDVVKLLKKHGYDAETTGLTGVIVYDSVKKDSIKDDDFHSAKQYAARLAKAGELTSIIVSKIKAAFPKLSTKELQSALENATGLRLSEKEFADSLKTFTVKYTKDSTVYVRKVKASTMQDAISKVKDVYNKFEHETDKEYLKSSINEMSRYIRNWSFMTTREKRNISPEGLATLKQMLKFAQQRLAELK